MSLVGSLIAVSLLILAVLGVMALFMAGTRSKDANEDDPPPPDSGPQDHR